MWFSFHWALNCKALQFILLSGDARLLTPIARSSDPCPPPAINSEQRRMSINHDRAKPQTRFSLLYSILANLHIDLYSEAQKEQLDNSILDMQVALGQYQTVIKSGSANGELPQVRSEEETIEHILKHEKSAAGIWCQLKTHHGTQASQLPLMKDVLGIVALLGKVDDDNLSRLLSDYLGPETMLAIVCKTYDGIKALETYDKEGHINKTSVFYGLGASIGRPLDGHFLVICLEKLRPYAGNFIADDPPKNVS
ncbi:hypothetical protein HAX54_023538 [Datura stramonium]|uniref:Uncharacterized protein n=1 Tax=Datura stramonium TaxID=4076 RepID=A0ABS8S4S3_DATST|nr:hypothetical protein [Datura stramonium]